MSTKILEQDIQTQKYTTTGGTTAYAITVPNLTALYDWLRVTVKMNATNTGSSTLNVNGLGAKTMKIAWGGNLWAWYLQQDTPYELEYNLSQDVWYVISNMNTTISSWYMVSNIITGSLTYEDNSQSDIVIAHWLWVIPKVIIGNQFWYQNLGASQTYYSGNAVYDWVTITQKTYNARASSSGADTYVDSLFLYRPTDFSDSGNWTISAIDATNITLAYTFGGSYGGTITAPYMITVMW